MERWTLQRHEEFYIYALRSQSLQRNSMKCGSEALYSFYRPR
jgi:hypothetical protein